MYRCPMYLRSLERAFLKSSAVFTSINASPLGRPSLEYVKHTPFTFPMMSQSVKKMIRLVDIFLNGCLLWRQNYTPFSPLFHLYLQNITYFATLHASILPREDSTKPPSRRLSDNNRVFCDGAPDSNFTPSHRDLLEKVFSDNWDHRLSTHPFEYASASFWMLNGSVSVRVSFNIQFKMENPKTKNQFVFFMFLFLKQKRKNK